MNQAPEYVIALVFWLSTVSTSGVVFLRLSQASAQPKVMNITVRTMS